MKLELVLEVVGEFDAQFLHYFKTSNRVFLNDLMEV